MTPLVSCLMVTLPVPERLGFVQTSVAGYLAQSHPAKELVVLVNGGTAQGRAGVCDYLASLNRADIKIIAPQGDLRVGALRNLALDHAQGDLTCQWDDDDLYHPARLARQLEALRQTDALACYLAEVMQYVPRRNALYWTNWQAAPGGFHPGTLMARRTAALRYPTDPVRAQLGEDSHAALTLLETGPVHRLHGAPELFIYVSHGANSWDDGHHDMLANRLAISRGLLQRREPQIRAALQPFAKTLHGVALHGPNGIAFKL